MGKVAVLAKGPSEVVRLTNKEMQYFGGKARLGPKIAAYLNELRQPGQTYLEPFVGGANIISRITGDGSRIGSDICQPLIALYQALQAGWEPPTVVSEADYALAKAGGVEPHLQAFIGFGCSFAGKWFGGFARGGHGADAPTGRNYALNALNALNVKRQTLTGVSFFCASYNQYTPKGALIYCDPPYAGTTGYTAAGKWDSAAFWSLMDDWATRNTVVVSEYSAPSGWACVREFPVHTDIRGKAGVIPRVERLFMKAQEN